MAKRRARSGVVARVVRFERFGTPLGTRSGGAALAIQPSLPMADPIRDALQHYVLVLLRLWLLRDAQTARRAFEALLTERLHSPGRCQRPGCTNPVRPRKGSNGRLTKYCSDRCRRTVQDRKRRGLTVTMTTSKGAER